MDVFLRVCMLAFNSKLPGPILFIYFLFFQLGWPLRRLTMEEEEEEGEKMKWMKWLFVVSAIFSGNIPANSIFDVDTWCWFIRSFDVS